MTTSDDFRTHVEALEAKSIAGDEEAVRSLAAMALLISGWRYGDPDPDDTPPDDDGGIDAPDYNIVTLNDYRRAA